MNNDAVATVERIADAVLPTEHGKFRIVGYRSRATGEEFVALVKGTLTREEPTLVRIHSQCLTGDVFHSLRCDCGRQLAAALELVELEGRGVILYQQQEGRGIGIVNKIRAYAEQDAGLDTVDANLALGFAADARSYDECAAVLCDLGLQRVRVMSNNPEKLKALEDNGFEIVERVELHVEPHDGFAFYLATKRDRMGHLIDPSEPSVADDREGPVSFPVRPDGGTVTKE